jgi:hypothetical protein
MLGTLNRDPGVKVKGGRTMGADSEHRRIRVRYLVRSAGTIKAIPADTTEIRTRLEQVIQVTVEGFREENVLHLKHLPGLLEHHCRRYNSCDD